MSETIYRFELPNGLGCHYPCDSDDHAIRFAEDDFVGVERIAIRRVITEYHNIGTLENGVFTAATQEPTPKDELLKALESAIEWLGSARGEEPDDFNNPGLDDVISNAMSAIAKAKGGAK